MSRSIKYFVKEILFILENFNVRVEIITENGIISEHTSVNLSNLEIISDDIISKLENIVVSKNKPVELIKNNGINLYKTLFPNIQIESKTGIQLTFDKELSFIPVEWAYKEDGFLFNKFPISRRIKNYYEESAKEKVKSKEITCAIINNLYSEQFHNADAEKESNNVNKVFRKNSFYSKIFTRQNEENHDLPGILKSHKIVHYIGHQEQDGILLKNGKYFNEENIKNLGDLSNIELLFLNSCNSGESEELITALFEKGVKNLVVTSSNVENREASLFSSKFYENLIVYNNVSKALNKTKSENNFVDWGSYIHYGNLNEKLYQKELKNNLWFKRAISLIVILILIILSAIIQPKLIQPFTYKLLKLKLTKASAEQYYSEFKKLKNINNPNQLPKIESLLYNAINSSENRYKYKFELAKQYLKYNDQSNAKNLLNTIIKNYPDSVLPFIELANIYLESKEYDKSLNAIFNLIYLSPSDSINSIISYTYFDNKYFIDNLKFTAYERYLADPQNKKNYKVLAFIYKEQKDWLSLLEITKKRPQNDLVLKNIIDCYIALNDTKTAKYYARKRLNNQKNKYSYFDYGRCLYWNAEYDSALIYFNKVIDLDSNSYNAHAFIGRIYERSSLWTKAKHSYFNTLKNSPNNDQAFVGLGNIYLNHSLYDSSIYYFEKYLFQNPTDSTVLQNVAALSYRKKNYEKSAFYYNKLNFYYPKVSTQNKLLYTLILYQNSLITENKYNELLEPCVIALQIDSSICEICFNYGLALAYQRNWDKAKEYFDKSYQLLSQIGYSEDSKAEQRTERESEILDLYNYLNQPEEFKKIFPTIIQ